MRHSHKLIFLMIAYGTTLTAGAQGLTDPTRPPGALAAAAGDGVATGGPVLQSVMLSPGRKMAVISGEIVALGGRYGSTRLVKLTESEAVLKDGAETTVLKLFPLVEKRMAGDVKKSAARTTK
jgi:MSHA biogenesis protein MshK